MGNNHPTPAACSLEKSLVTRKMTQPDSETVLALLDDSKLPLGAPHEPLQPSWMEVGGHCPLNQSGAAGEVPTPLVCTVLMCP